MYNVQYFNCTCSQKANCIEITLYKYIYLY